MSEPVAIIYPPADLKAIVDKTATYVAKNGGKFEEKIIQEQRGKPKFSFLFPNDPFNAYYRHKVNEIRHALVNEARSQSEQKSEDPRRDDVEVPQQQLAVTGEDATKRKADQRLEDDTCDIKDDPDQSRSAHIEDESGLQHIKPQLDEYIQEKTMKLEEPPPLNFLASPAPASFQTECDIIKLTSQFIATHGRSFLLELVSREQSNSLFDFLKPQHGQFAYMTNLVMQYALIQNPPLDILEHLEKDATSQTHVLDRIKMRAEWNRMLEVERRKREEAEEKEKELYNQIDWHDFVVVETVDYHPDEKGEYPPTTAEQVGTRLLKQQRLEDKNNPREMEMDMDVESDQDSDVDESAQAEDEFASPLPPDLNKVNIRRDYDPKAAPRAVPIADNYFVSPITNERIPVDKIHEHVRYNLADPKYLEKKEQILQGKMNEEVVFASGSQIQDSLKNLAERRSDIFGMNDAETAIGQRIGEVEEEQSKKEDKIIWDGHKSSIKKKKLN